MLLKNGSFYYEKRLVSGDLRVTGETIAAFSPQTAGGLVPLANEEVLELGGAAVIPAFLDIHTHGAVGVDVNAASAEDFEKLARFFARQGTGSFLCSILTDTEEQTERAIQAFLDWRKLPHAGADLLGIHLEGPFLSPKHKGAMPESLLRTPDYDLIARYQEKAEGHIRYITLAPELPGAIELIPKLRALGIVTALGHSDADYRTTEQAIFAGARAATHTGNAMRAFDRHEPAIFGAVLASEEVYCEMISDGLHLHPGSICLYLQAKGLDRAIAITDSIMAAGLPDGEYMLGVNAVVVKDGDARLKHGDARAGSTLTMARAFRNLRKFTGRPTAELVPLLSENAACLLGEDKRIGNLTPGKRADLLILKDDEIHRVMLRGAFCNFD